MLAHHTINHSDLSFAQEISPLLYLLPLVSFFMIVFFGKKSRFLGSEIGIGSTFLVWILALKIAYVHYVNLSETSSVVKLIKPNAEIFGIQFSFGTLLDGLSIIMIVTVSTISLLVHIFSVSYMKKDVRFTHYYSMLSLFTASMMLCVVAPTSLQLMIGWELVGICSFLLIGHWWEKDENVFAALKAFFMTRTADIGLLVGTVLTFFIVKGSVSTGSFSIPLINEIASTGVNKTLLILTAIAFLIAILGKSGQFPLHTWLPDAMAGPTPVSALIHAATMVVAGVFLCARMYPIFYQAFQIEIAGFNILAIAGAVTIIVGAFCAFRQDNLKKVLAYSTVSQLGYMVMALGVGAWSASIFHLFTHAFFKALLFLCAGAISVAATHHSFDMKKDMGGLRKYMPVTFLTFMSGTLALLGVFPFAGFWSKDEILAVAGNNGYMYFQIVGIVGALMTAMYMTRCVYLVFFGKYRGKHEPVEADNTMKFVMIILGVASLVAGLVNATAFNIHKFVEFLGESTFSISEHLAHEHEKFQTPLALIVTALTAIAVLTWLFWNKKFNKNKKVFYFPTLDTLYMGIVNLTKKSAFFVYDIVETKGLDGINKGLEVTTSASGLLVEKQQKQKIRFGLIAIVLVVVLFVLFLGGK